jgi:hypothetical protein
MNMYLNTAPNPVEQGYGGGDALNTRRLHEFCAVTSSNFSLIQGELSTLRLELNTARHTNRQLTQLLNWIAVTNPQILDEFQTTAHAFDKLVPRDTGDESVQSASP